VWLTSETVTAAAGGLAVAAGAAEEVAVSGSGVELAAQPISTQRPAANAAIDHPVAIMPFLMPAMPSSTGSLFEHLRHKPPAQLAAPRELILACPEFRSRVNLSNIVRTCGCFGIQRVIACGSGKLDERIARDGADAVQIEVHRSLPPVLDRLKREGWQLVGLEQATHSENLFSFKFVSRTVLVIGNERLGIEPEVLTRLDRVAEIPMAGLPHSLNAATSTALAIYEYCRQFPEGGDGRPGAKP
jgi:tRNA(Leu) C34 or U34 (ribose-2'-O)-methylase TrmL